MGSISELMRRQLEASFGDGHLGPLDGWPGVGIESNVVHSGGYQIAKATVIRRWHGAGGGAAEWELKGHEMWIEHSRQCLQERNDRGLWRVVMGRHEFWEETVQPTRR